MLLGLLHTSLLKGQCCFQALLSSFSLIPFEKFPHRSGDCCIIFFSLVSVSPLFMAISLMHFFLHIPIEGIVAYVFFFDIHEMNKKNQFVVFGVTECKFC